MMSRMVSRMVSMTHEQTMTQDQNHAHDQMSNQCVARLEGWHGQGPQWYYLLQYLAHGQG